MSPILSFRSGVAGWAALVLAASCASSALAAEIPPHPRQLEHPPLDFEVPRAEGLRHELPGGIPVYVVEDRTLPLVDVSIQIRAGAFLEPADKVGLARLTGVLMRSGGAGELSAQELDERADFLAAAISTSMGATSGSASVDCLSSVLDECLELFFDVLERPRFEQGRLELEKQNLLAQLEQRNDHPQSIASREWQWLLYGDEHFASRHVTGDSLAAIRRDDLVAFHQRAFQPRNMVFAVSGDVETEEVLSALGKHLADWSVAAAESVPWPPEEPRFVPRPGLYVVEKDIPQGRAQLGHLGVKRERWDDPDAFALSLMNDILGGGGFTSRLTRRIRSDEGLAYSAGATFGVGNFWSGQFFAYFQSKSPTVAYAAKIAREEIERMRREPVTDEELATAKASFIDTFPRNFDSASTVASLFATDEYLGRPHDYWYRYRERVAAVTKEDILRVARERLHPEQMVFLVVGKWTEIAPGDPDGKATMKEFFGGEARMLPERDPVTLEPVGR
jgi:zinc protease